MNKVKNSEEKEKYEFFGNNYTFLITVCRY